MRFSKGCPRPRERFLLLFPALPAVGSQMNHMYVKTHLTSLVPLYLSSQKQSLYLHKRRGAAPMVPSTTVPCRTTGPWAGFRDVATLFLFLGVRVQGLGTPGPLLRRAKRLLGLSPSRTGVKSTRVEATCLKALNPETPARSQGPLTALSWRVRASTSAKAAHQRQFWEGFWWAKSPKP